MSSPLKRILFYIAASIAPLLALFLRLVLERLYGELPHYVLFYPVVLLMALLGGVWAGLLSTTTSALLVVYWVLPPKGQFKVEQTSDAIGLAIFSVMGFGMSVVAELYHRNRQMLATYQKEQAVQSERRAADARYRMLFDSIDEGFCTIEVLFDAHGKPNNWRYLEVNPAFERHTGFQRAAGMTILELIPKVETQWLDIYGTVAATGKPIRLILRSAALSRWFDLYVFPVGEPEQHRLAILFTDITERKLAEEALLRSEKLAATGRLAATIAHEVNNPLSSALNAIYIANTNPAQVSEMLKLAEEELRRAAHITQQTLGFYRENSQAQISLPKVVEEVLVVYAAKLRNRNITVQRRYRCDIGSRRGGCPVGCEGCEGCFLVNAGELRQIISNLLANGIDALSDGGLLQVRVSRLPHRTQLTIADNGSGIRTENLKRIFEPFFTTKKDFGTGLGLWVTQELVRKHNGVIKVRSSKDKGTVFRLTFPPETALNSNFGDDSQTSLAKSA
jgi:PAS domain S-box-containing protein